MDAQELRQRLNDLKDLADFRPIEHSAQNKENGPESHEDSRFEDPGMKTVLEKYVPRFEATWSERQDAWDGKLNLSNYVKLSRQHKTDLNTDHLCWLTVQANLVPGRDKDIILNIPVFWFMQFYPWCLRPYKETYRLFVGHLATYKDECEAWHEPLNIIFELNNMKMNDKETTEAVARWQDAHILAVAKVLARFLGLVCDRHPEDDHKLYRIHGGWKKFPFADREEDRDENPYQKFTAFLNSGDQGELSDGDDEGVDEDETGYFNGIDDDKPTPEELAAANNDPAKRYTVDKASSSIYALTSTNDRTAPTFILKRDIRHSVVSFRGVVTS
ncbi:hypothetical protein M436DRAFT_64569 [Aureobasidium namibiae CBS 147.97]|uniref:Uncharacterized protein n=1 Tax=Aureobasidium namibiae CBS 147.97 TaxID=1043004 RepID=A0A074WS77_9PEZI